MKYLNKVFTIQKDTQLTKSIELKKGQEIEVVRDVVYMGGYPIPFGMQDLFLQWVITNEKSLIDKTRKY